MQMRFRTIAENRKDAVKAMEQILNVKAKYLGPPTFDYEVGSFRVDRDGFIETASEEEGMQMQKELIERGLAEGERSKMDIELPLEGFTADNLKNLVYMIHSKQYLLERAVGAEVLKVSADLVTKLTEDTEATLEMVIQTIEEAETVGLSFTEDRIQFNGFPFMEEESKAYTELVSAMVKAAKEQKRINPQETREANEKYYMRIWLVRLGFGGKEAKETRNILLARLKGHTAFRTEADREKWKERYGKKAASSAE